MEFRIITDWKVSQITFAFKLWPTKKIIRFTIQLYRDPTAWVNGIGSRCENGRHVLFFDYDSTELKPLIGEIKELQSQFKLSHAYIFKMDRANSYHVIILDKFSAKRAYHILGESNIDFGYRESVKKVKGREWVLRVAKKGNRKAPLFAGMVISKYDLNEISTAHKSFIQKWYFVPKKDYKKEDNIKEVPLINYNTGNRVD